MFATRVGVSMSRSSFLAYVLAAPTRKVPRASSDTHVDYFKDFEKYISPRHDYLATRSVEQKTSSDNPPTPITNVVEVIYTEQAPHPIPDLAREYFPR